VASATDIARLRRDVGADENSLPDYDADDIFVEAAETYSNATAAAAYARVLAIQGLLASSAKLTNYRQNNSSEDASDVFEHLSNLLKLWEQKTADAQKATGSGAMRFGATGKKPTRVKEYPDS
jgi:hypothetical protein